MPAQPDAFVQPSREEVAARRAALFRETWRERLERWLLGTAWALKPNRIDALPALARLWISDLVAPQRDLPDPEHTLHSNGMCGMVRDLSPLTLVEAYKRGLFTFAHFGPLKWLSLPERCVLFYDELHVGKTVRRLLRQDRYRVTFDRDFEGVIKACAGRRDGKWHVTWITPRIMRAYAELYDAGFVHSFEVWNGESELVGGGYGVAIGRVFFTESQFSHESNTSKLGFTVLNWHLAKWGFLLNDGKWETPTIREMGFRLIPRTEFLRLLDRGTSDEGKFGRWQVEASPTGIAAWQAKGAPPTQPGAAADLPYKDTDTAVPVT
jgi:leucyl/phenylalanyl-tRNA--protein transferase